MVSPSSSFCLLLVFCLRPTHGYTSRTPPFLRRQDVTGIWKLTRHPRPPSERKRTTEEEEENEVVLRLNDDGTFDPYTTVPTTSPNIVDDWDPKQILGWGGCWEYRDGTLILAADRPRMQARNGDAEQHPESRVGRDAVFAGKLEARVSRPWNPVLGMVKIKAPKQKYRKRISTCTYRFRRAEFRSESSPTSEAQGILRRPNALSPVSCRKIYHAPALGRP